MNLDGWLKSLFLSSRTWDSNTTIKLYLWLPAKAVALHHLYCADFLKEATRKRNFWIIKVVHLPRVRRTARAKVPSGGATTQAPQFLQVFKFTRGKLNADSPAASLACFVVQLQELVRCRSPNGERVFINPLMRS